MKAPAKSFDACLAAFSPEQRAALQKLRKDINAAAPGLEECVAYGLASFRLDGKFFVAIGGGANHCAFYPGTALKALGQDLKKYDTAKGTIRFAPEKPLPATLVKKVIKARLAQHAAKAKVRKKR